MKAPLLLSLGLILLCSFYIPQARAVTINAANCSQEAVQTAINQAQDGDTVMVPAGSCAWSSAVDITKPLTIIGAGSGVGGTTFTASGSMTNGFFYLTDITYTGLMRISGFNFQMNDITASRAIVMYSSNLSLSQLRIDHNVFHNGYSALNIAGSKGVVDNNYFYDAYRGIDFNAGTRAQADASWESMAAGIADALFIEDNYFIMDTNFMGTTNDQCIDTANGGKLVIRYNHFDATNPPPSYDRIFNVIQAHGSANGGSGGNGYWQSDPLSRRGQSVIEIYNNVVAGKRASFLYAGRGGANLIHDNTLTTVQDAPARIYFYEEEQDHDYAGGWTPARTAWPAEDQIHNTFIWNNTFNGLPQSISNIGIGDSSADYIQLNRDYFLHAPQATGGKEIFVCANGVFACNGASGSYPTDGNTYPTLGTMVFDPSEPNAYYGYQPYTYPHPLTQTNIISAASCSQADVQNAINSAQDGDTIQIPAGSCTWSSAVTVTKGITLMGSGETSTVITADNTGLLDIDISGAAFRLSGMGFKGNAAGAILIDGAFTGLRVDHCRFTDISGRCFIIGYYTQLKPAITGVFDHITYVDTSTSTTRNFMLLYGDDNAWNMPDDYGSANAVFIEDSSFTFAAGAFGVVCDGEHGARLVMRHNTITNGQLGWHDTGSTPAARSTRKFELYNNTFYCTTLDCGWGAIGFRGGTGVVFNNIIPIYPNGYENPSASQIFRVTAIGGKPWTTACDGTVDRICSDFRSHCSASDHRACAGDYDCTGAGTCSIDACTQDSECGSGNTCLQKFDGHLDFTGWPCRDQTGRGQDDPVTHVQASSPLYWWNDIDGNKKCTDSLRHCVGGSHNACWSDSDCTAGPCMNACISDSDCPAGQTCSNHQLSVYVAPANANYIKENRDYCNHDTTTACGSNAAWTYTPYTYPHPLRLESTCIHKSDLDCNGCVDTSELMAFIDRWKVDSSNPTLKELIEAIGLWKKGCS